MSAAAVALDWRKISAYSDKMGPKANYPTVIIGAGLGGLCCGAFLAKQGVPVTLIEQHNIPGGYATAFDRAEGSFTFDVSLHGIAIHNNATERILNELGVLKELDIVKLPEIFRQMGPDVDFTIQQHPEHFISFLTSRFPSEEQGIRRFFDKIARISEEVNKLHKKDGKFFILFFPFQYKNMWNVRNTSLADLLNQYTQNRELQNFLASFWAGFGLPPSKLSAFYYSVAVGDYLKNGAYYIKNNSQTLSNKLAEIIMAHNGKIIFETRVEKILVQNKRVAGVKLDNGDTLSAKAVVSNSNIISTFTKMIPQKHVPQDYLRKINACKPSLSSFVVWLGLNRELKGKIKAYCTHVESGQDPEQGYLANLNGDVKNGPYSVTIYDNLYKGYSMPGKTTVALLFFCGYEPWKKFEEDYKREIKTDYYAEKQKWTDILIHRTEKLVIPGLSQMIEVQESATPLTNWRFTGNPNGAIYGSELTPENTFISRIKNRTPVKGLYLAGAWGYPGGGYSGVLLGSQNTFKCMMKDWASEQEMQGELISPV